MKGNKQGLVVAVVLTIILAIIVIYSKGFEHVLSTFFSSKGSEGSRTLLSVYFMEHLWMVVLSSVIAILIGTSIGIFITTSVGSEFKDLVLKTVNLGQAFPSPALLALAVPLLGYGIKGALIALVIYVLMPIVYNVVTGIEEVPEDIVDAAKGMGMSEIEVYMKVKIPLALNIILGGIRTALVINISATTLAATVGAGGLGVLVVNGVKTFDMVLILEGVIPVTLLAIIVELLLKGLQQKLIWE